MPWNLEIHHIDVEQGDATLIVARNGAITRSVLIDGGRRGGRLRGVYLNSQTIHNYLLEVGIQSLNVIIVTHYDADHLQGITELLKNYPGMYDNTIIYDQGWSCMDNNYIQYVLAINGLQNIGGNIRLAPSRLTIDQQYERQLNRSRPTNFILSNTFQNIPGLFARGPQSRPPAIPVGGIRAIQNIPHWLIGREVMWTDGTGAYQAVLHGGAIQAGDLGGPPRIRCIAANTGVLQNNGTVGFLTSGNHAACTANERNESSLAFEIRFNNFKYYIGGDIHSAQEDGINAIQQPAGTSGLMNYLNNPDDLLNRVHAMKLSHHGSRESSSAMFVNRLRPKVAFVSCGLNNGFGINQHFPPGHPNQDVVERVSANPNTQRVYITNDRSTADYSARIALGILNPVGSGHYSNKSIVAGAWGPPFPPAPFWPDGSPVDGPLQTNANIVLNVNEAQAQMPAGNLPFTVTHTHPLVNIGGQIRNSTTLIY